MHLSCWQTLWSSKRSNSRRDSCVIPRHQKLMLCNLTEYKCALTPSSFRFAIAKEGGRALAPDNGKFLSLTARPLAAKSLRLRLNQEAGQAHAHHGAEECRYTLQPV